MGKVKIVQIAVGGAGTIDGTEFRELFLDDKGRVWYEGGHYKKSVPGRPQEWVHEWLQLELPEERP